MCALDEYAHILIFDISVACYKYMDVYKDTFQIFCILKKSVTFKYT